MGARAAELVEHATHILRLCPRCRRTGFFLSHPASCLLQAVLSKKKENNNNLLNGQQGAAPLVFKKKSDCM